MPSPQAAVDVVVKLAFCLADAQLFRSAVGVGAAESLWSW
jgi:hypothetical protein